MIFSHSFCLILAWLEKILSILSLSSIEGGGGGGIGHYGPPIGFSYAASNGLQ